MFYVIVLGQLAAQLATVAPTRDMVKQVLHWMTFSGRRAAVAFSSAKSDFFITSAVVEIFIATRFVSASVKVVFAIFFF